MKKILSFLFSACIITSAPAQQPAGGSGLVWQKTPCLDSTLRQEIIHTLQENTSELQRKGILSIQPSVTAAIPVNTFIWPLKQAPGFADPGFYGISNYVDEDTSSAVLDYNCGTVTYNGHKGTDIFTWPFGWTKMDSNAVQIIAAASGTIIGKSDGIPDKSCAACTNCDWNAVYVLNQDGSICWYGHMKTGSLLSKPVGAAVTQGEFLGIVGSSGNSTGPHLHFEVYTDSRYTQLLDPWQGSCNKLGNPSLWISQQSYKSPYINKIATHNDPPTTSTCYGGENAHYSDQFIAGSRIYFAVYLKDQQPSTQANFTIIRPDNSIFSQFVHVLSTYYAASYWYWSYTLPVNAPAGTWKFRYQYNGQLAEHSFFVSAVMPLRLLDFRATQLNSLIRLTWLTANEEGISGFDLERSGDGQTFSPIGHVLPKGSPDVQQNSYAYVDPGAVNGVQYYRLKILDKDGQFSYSPVVTLPFSAGASSLQILGNPVGNKLGFLFRAAGPVRVSIVAPSGKTVLARTIRLEAGIPSGIPIHHLPAGNYYLILDSEGKQYSRSFIKQ